MNKLLKGFLTVLAGAIVAFFMTALIYCAYQDSKLPYHKGSKMIVAKETGVEGNRSDIHTNYYLIARDGTYLSVTVTDYALTKVGDYWYSENWQKRYGR